MSMTQPKTTLTRGQYAPLPYRSSPAPRSTLPCSPRCCQEFLRDDLRAGRADWIANPSLKLTRYGRHCKPGLSHSHYRLSPGLQYLPPRAA